MINIASVVLNCPGNLTDILKTDGPSVLPVIFFFYEGLTENTVIDPVVRLDFMSVSIVF